jgi:hypothetical protein
MLLWLPMLHVKKCLLKDRSNEIYGLALNRNAYFLDNKKVFFNKTISKKYVTVI